MSGYFEFTISQIENGYQKISDFHHETFFWNIYHFWCFFKVFIAILHLGKYSIKMLTKKY